MIGLTNLRTGLFDNMSPPVPPITPQRQRDSLQEFLGDLNRQYELAIPIPENSSPRALRNNNTPPDLVYKGLKKLYYSHPLIIDSILAHFEEWVSGNSAVQEPRTKQQWSWGQWGITKWLHQEARDERVSYLLHLIKDEEYMLENKHSDSNERAPKNLRETNTGFSPKKRRISYGDDDEFHTAPNSPSKGIRPVTPDLRRLEISEHGEPFYDQQGDPSQTPAPTFMDKILASQIPRNQRRYDAPLPAMDAVNTSFSTATGSSLFSSHTTGLGESFATDVTEPMDSQSTYADSVIGILMEQKMTMNADLSAPDDQTNSLQEHLVT